MKLEPGHALTHDGNTAFQRRALGHGETVGDADHRSRVFYEVALRDDGRTGQQRMKGRGKFFGRDATRHHGLKLMGEMAFLLSAQRDFVLDGIGNAAKQVGVADRPAERRRELRNGQRKSPRHALQYVRLIRLVGIQRSGRGGCHGITRVT